MAATPRIAFVNNLLIHYRIPFFNLLAACGKSQFRFFFGGVHPWMKEFARVNGSYRPDFRYVILRGLRLIEYNYFSPLLFFWLLRDQYDAYIGSPLSSIDCLITFVVAKSLRKPFIVWDERWESPRSLLSKIFEPILFMMANRADAIVVPGLRSFEYFRARISAKKSTTLVIAPNASVLSKPSSLSVKEFRQLHRIPDKKKVIVYLGRLSAEKGIDLLLRSYAILERDLGERVFLLIAGEGEERKYLQPLAETLDLHNIGFTCREIYEQAACLSVADVVVVPSSSKVVRSEVWGLVVNEAASLGRPVIVSETVGCAIDIVAHFQCGYLVKEDPRELSRAIRDILLHPKLAHTMGANGIRATKETFNFQRMAQSFDHTIHQAIAKTHK